MCAAVSSHGGNDSDGDETVVDVVASVDVLPRDTLDHIVSFLLRTDLAAVAVRRKGDNDRQLPEDHREGAGAADVRNQCGGVRAQNETARRKGGPRHAPRRERPI